MLDPGIKQEEGYFVYDSGSKDDVWVKQADGKKPFIGIFTLVLWFFNAILSCYLDVYMQNLLKFSVWSTLGEVWPGPCVFPDYTNSKTRFWWASLVKDFISNGVDGIWNDMNEPAVFNVNFVYFAFYLL